MTDFLYKDPEDRKSNSLLIAGYPSNFRYYAYVIVIYVKKTPSMSHFPCGSTRDFKCASAAFEGVHT